MSKIPKRFSENGEVLGSLVEDGGVLQDPNIITVGNSVYDTYSSLPDAVESITDSSATNPYKILLKPGVFTVTKPIVLPSYVALIGSGRQLTRVECTAWNNIKMGVENEVADITFVGTNMAADGVLFFGPVRASGTKIHDIDVFLHGGVKSAIHMQNYNHTVYFTNVLIVTDSIGATLRGNVYINFCNVFISGDGTGTDYIGLNIPTYCRLYLHGSKIGTGYGSTNEGGYGANLEVVNDPNSSVIGINIPSTNPVTPRLQLHGLESFCRNPEATVKPVNGIHCVKAAHGWVRMFGSFVQSEAPLVFSAQDALYTDGDGIIEVYGTRYSTSSGRIVTRGQEAVSALSFTADNNLILDNWDGGTKFCDATSGALNLVIKDLGITSPKGVKYTFIKTDSSANPVVITSQDLKTTAGGTTITLANQYDKVTLVSAGGTAGLFEV